MKPEEQKALNQCLADAQKIARRLVRFSNLWDDATKLVRALRAAGANDKED